MENEALRAQLLAAGEEVTDEHGAVIGYIAQPARFRIRKPYLAMGGFLVVTRDEESGQYIGTEYDALAHPKTREPYPAGHSELAWTAQTLEEACLLVGAYFAPSTETATSPGEQTEVDRVIDLRGDHCPITFAKTKIALEEIAIGQVLRILLDYEPATKNVPRSAELYGDEVLSLERTGAQEWAVMIRKRVE
jgi:tRNA 2-thiouridine synthesizing protein A